ncbi:hypothetical protein GCM10010168_20550 [Actinoplanes ianthinogenes]|uniref:NB-ARC domain-containing protein n=1 Tax=Actinoplanes ianthinogenes TaxID=122358 RepID=A0ABM7M7W0_9ACTN|nr:tetratricopeptide repeat protein [Actinoplanes ianthinogenes]BCJ47696.1 hypothetical protein Aiant_83530 [Actinoplanes ianthinogenes]GGR03537.1 hypothetical protein GCM10010168_20550 [Actinoplanes ianthinogenes]
MRRVENAPSTPGDAFTGPPDPAPAASLDDLVGTLRRLKVWAGSPSYETIKCRVDAAWTSAGRPAGELVSKSTVAYCFRPGRRRLDPDLVVAVVEALHPDAGYAAAWRQALRVVGGEIEAVSQVRVQDSLPPDLPGFTGRAAELDRLRQVAGRADAEVIAAIEGMPGVGKTRLAVHAGHLLHHEQPFERVLFVDLRGFGSDPAQPPAEPAAVLDGFLRLLGMSGQQIPHALDARVAAYRARLAGTRTLAVLDNAATDEQIRPLLPNTPGCLTLVTSRRRLTALRRATHLSVHVFAPGEAMAYLTRAVPDGHVRDDPQATARIARRCGYLPLALGLVAGHIRRTPGWTLRDHADRLDERHHQRRLDTGVDVALHMSYQHLPTGRQRLLRLLALHPGPDLDVHAAAALAGTDVPTAQADLDHLHRDHLLHQTAPGRYGFHGLVRTYAITKAHDEDRPPARRAALTRVFDHYLATAAAAMSTLHPTETHWRPRIAPAGPSPRTWADPAGALRWLNTERPALVAVAVHTATHGWPTHTVQLSRTLFRYLIAGHPTEARIIFTHALRAADDVDDATAKAYAVNNLGIVDLQQNQPGRAVEHFRRALHLHRQAGDALGQALARNSLGEIDAQSGHYASAIDHFEQAVLLCRQSGDHVVEARALTNLGIAEARWGSPAGLDHLAQALAGSRRTGNLAGEEFALIGAGIGDLWTGAYQRAGDHFHQALPLSRRLGDRTGEAAALNCLGSYYAYVGDDGSATDHHRQALAVFREIGDRCGQAWALHGLAETSHRAGRLEDARHHFGAALALAVTIGARHQQALARAGLGAVHQALGEHLLARQDYQHAVELYTDLDMPAAADQIRVRLASLGSARR